MLAGRSQRTTWRRGDPFFFERCDGILVHERFLAQPDSMRIDVLIFVPCFSDACLLLRSFIWCIAEPHVFIKCHQGQSQGLGKTSTRKKNVFMQASSGESSIFSASIFCSRFCNLSATLAKVVG